MNFAVFNLQRKMLNYGSILVCFTVFSSFSTIFLVCSLAEKTPFDRVKQYALYIEFSFSLFFSGQKVFFEKRLWLDLS